MKKKRFLDFHHPGTWVAIFALLGASGTAIVGTAKYITLPERVEGAEQRISDVERYITEQQVANQVQQKILNKIVDKEISEDKVMLSPDKKYFWDNKMEIWRPIRELKELEND